MNPILESSDKKKDANKSRDRYQHFESKEDLNFIREHDFDNWAQVQELDQQINALKQSYSVHLKESTSPKSLATKMKEFNPLTASDNELQYT